MKKYYITTAIDYVNGRPHLGHAFEKVIADAIARWKRLEGKKVFFLTGTDENAQKIFQTANVLGIPVKEFVDNNAKLFRELCEKLNISNDDFIRTTEKRHVKFVKKILKKIYKKKDIYKSNYEGLYCYGCEAYKTEKDLVDGRCPEHPNQEIVKIEEEAYFFRLSKYKEKIIEFVKTAVIPEKRKNEILSRLQQEELHDLCISRIAEWGIEIPFDKNYRVYVWFDALLNYLSGGKNNWPADVQIIGKDINWFHSVVWPAILISSGYELPRKILVHGFLKIGETKMSKSAGIGLDPFVLIERYGCDVLRYALLRNSIFEDSDFSEQVIIERNNKELADKLGNLILRVTSLAEKHGIEKCENDLLKKLNFEEIRKHFENFELDKVLSIIFKFIEECNLYVQKEELWKTGDKKKIYKLCDSIKAIAILLWPFIPETSTKIAKQLGFKIKNIKDIEKPLKIRKIKKGEVLFKKIELKEKEEEKVEKIPFEQWAKLDLRVGKILQVRPHPNADKLLLLDVDLGELGQRTLVAGIKQHYTEKELKGKQIIVFTNLEPKEIRGVRSEGMVLAAVSKDKSKVILISPEKPIEPGSKIE